MPAAKRREITRSRRIVGTDPAAPVLDEGRICWQGAPAGGAVDRFRVAAFDLWEKRLELTSTAIAANSLCALFLLSPPHSPPVDGEEGKGRVL